MGALHAVFAEEADGVGVEEYSDVLAVKHTLLHYFGCAQIIFAYNEVHLFGQRAEIQGFLTCCVAAAYDSDFLLAIEEAVACSARAYAHTTVFFLVGQTEILCAGAGGYDYSVSLYFVAVIGLATEGA